MAVLLFQGHASCRVVTRSGMVIYLDPAVGAGYPPIWCSSPTSTATTTTSPGSPRKPAAGSSGPAGPSPAASTAPSRWGTCGWRLSPPGTGTTPWTPAWAISSPPTAGPSTTPGTPPGWTPWPGLGPAAHRRYLQHGRRRGQPLRLDRGRPALRAHPHRPQLSLQPRSGRGLRWPGPAAAGARGEHRAVIHQTRKGGGRYGRLSAGPGPRHHQLPGHSL